MFLENVWWILHKMDHTFTYEIEQVQLSSLTSFTHTQSHENRFLNDIAEIFIELFWEITCFLRASSSSSRLFLSSSCLLRSSSCCLRSSSCLFRSSSSRLALSSASLLSCSSWKYRTGVGSEVHSKWNISIVYRWFLLLQYKLVSHHHISVIDLIC